MEDRVWRALPGVPSVFVAEAVREGVPLRATAFPLADGRLGIYSPIKGLGPGAHVELQILGTPGALVAPNAFHNLGLREYRAAYPEVVILAGARACARLSRIARHDVGDIRQLRLPPGATVLQPPGMRNGEVWLSLPGARGPAWLVGDGFFNIARTPRSAMGLILRALGTSPGLRIGSVYRWLMGDRPAYRAFVLDALARERPTTLVPCHGDVLSAPDLADQLARLVEARL